MKETWKHIPNTGELFQASDLGRIRGPKGIHRLYTQKSGYEFTSVFTGDPPRSVGRSVHSLVCEAFLGPKKHGYLQVDHIDGHKANNRLVNLEYVTPGENMQRAWAMGLCHCAKGSEHHAAKLTEADVVEMRSMQAGGTSPQELSWKFRVSDSTVSMIIRRRAWTHI